LDAFLTENHELDTPSKSRRIIFIPRPSRRCIVEVQ
jgi:hypothetical protein